MNLAELNYGQIKPMPTFEVAVLPLGATEPHNLHLPYGTDTIQVEVLAVEACRRAAERGARVVALPALPYGTETNQMRFPMAMNLNPSTVARVIADLVASLETHGVKKCLLLNGHGGNDLKWVLRELHLSTKVHLFLCNWWKMVADQYKDDLRGRRRPRRGARDEHDPGASGPSSWRWTGPTRGRWRARGSRR